MDKTDLTVSLVLYEHSPDDIAGLISDIRTIPLNTKLYIIDNSPEPLDLSVFESDKTEIIQDCKNLGYGKGHNVGIFKASEISSDFHLIVNPDIRFNGADIPLLIDFINKGENYGLVIPKVHYENGDFQYIYKLLPDPFVMTLRFLHRFLPDSFIKANNDSYEMRHKDFSNPFELPVVSGCFMFGRTKIFNEVDGFDDRFFMYFEDVDLSRRIGVKYRNMYYPDISVTHGFQKDSYKSKTLRNAHLLSAFKYFNKWGWFLDNYRREKNRSCR